MPPPFQGLGDDDEDDQDIRNQEYCFHRLNKKVGLFFIGLGGRGLSGPPKVIK